MASNHLIKLTCRRPLEYGTRVAHHRDETSGERIHASEPIYRLAATGRQKAEDERLSLLEEIFDPLSRQRRAFVQAGWRCLEVGAGRGSMAVWLARRVGVNGRVVATDVDITYLNRLSLQNLEVRRHDILSDPLDVLNPGSYDLVCARLVLFWLAGKQEIAIRRMVECLRPGGWLLDEDGDWGVVAPIDSSHPHYALYHRVWKNGEWWVSRGYDPTFGRKLPMLFERCGLMNIATKRAPRWCVEAAHGDGGGCKVWKRYVPPNRPMGASPRNETKNTERSPLL